ncbi:MAG: MFS transporter, partial [Candidatus Cloacimonetes bacterium]|nr:MFS transporter [Candidatus Cloacimonadota bacterium]
FIIFFILQNLRRPINIGFISDNISHDVMASGLSVESQLKTIFVAIMSPLMGFIADSINIGAAFIILSSLTLLIFPLIKVSRKVN